MTAPSRLKASDKSGICKKLVGVLKKRYKGVAVPKERSVLDSMLYAVCVENTTPDQADAAIERLMSGFHDLNEIRVSSVTELTSAFEGMEGAEWRAVQARAILQYVFEKHFAFDFEPLRKKTLDLAQKQIGKIRELSAFVRAWTLQEALGSHAVPMDAAMTRASIWLGLADLGSNEEQASNALRPVLRKNEAPIFCELLRAFGADPKFRRTLEHALASPPEDGFDVNTAPSRLTHLLEGEGVIEDDDDAPKSKGSKAGSKSAAKPAAKAPKEKSASKSGKGEAPKSTRPKSRSN